MRLQPTGAHALRLCQQLVEIDGARGAELLCGPDGDRAAGRDLHPKAHDRLVHRADLLDVEGAVGDALAVEDEKLLKHPVHRPVRDEGRPDALDNLPDTSIGVPAFEEREPVRVEYGAATLRQGDGAAGAVGARAVVNETEQDEELRPRPEALVHGVRMQGSVFTQALVKAAERVVAEEGVVLRQHAALLRVEQEDKAEDDSEEPSVDVVSVAVLGERLAKQLAAGSVVGGLEPADELVEGVHHLFREALAHLVLVLAAVIEEGGEPLRARQGEEALFGEEEAEGGAEGAPGGEAHVRDAEVHPARALPPRGGDEAKRDAVEEQAGGDPGAPEQTLGAALGPRLRGADRHRRIPARRSPAPRRAPAREAAMESRHRGGCARGRRSRGGGSRRSPEEEAPDRPEPEPLPCPRTRAARSPSRGRRLRARGNRRCTAPGRVRGRASARGCSQAAGSAPPCPAGSGSPPPSRAPGRRPPSRSAG